MKVVSRASLDLCRNLIQNDIYSIALPWGFKEFFPFMYCIIYEQEVRTLTCFK